MVRSKLHVLRLVLRLVCICRFGLFREPEPKQSDPLDSWARLAHHGASEKKGSLRRAAFQKTFQLVVGTHVT